MRWGDGRHASAGASRWLALMGVLVPAGAAHPDTVLSAEDLRDVCTRPSEAWASFCNGYARATADFAESSGLACIPDGTTQTELVTNLDELAFDRIATGEISRDLPAFAVTMSVLQTLYPCDTDGEAAE